MACTSILFDGHPELKKGFDKFLPPGFTIGDHQIERDQPTEKVEVGVPGTSLGGESNGSTSLITLPCGSRSKSPLHAIHSQSNHSICTSQHSLPENSVKKMNYVDQYQGGNAYQYPNMLDSYNANPQHGSCIPQVHIPALHSPTIYENRLPAATVGLIDADSLNSTHRMTSTHKETVIHYAQNQGDEQLTPTVNPVNEQSFNPSVSPVTQQPSYASQYLPPSNHIDGIQNSMEFSSNTDNVSASLRIKQLSSSSVERQRPVSATDQPVYLSESSSNVLKLSEKSTPHNQKSPIESAQSQQNESSNEARVSKETKVVNETKQSAESSNTNSALESSNERVEKANKSSKTESENDKANVSENNFNEYCDHVRMPTEIPPPRYQIPPSRYPTPTSSYSTPNQGLMMTPDAYRHLFPHHNTTSSIPLQPNCMTLPPSLPASRSTVMPYVSTTGISDAHEPNVPSMNTTPMPNETNSDSNQSPFLWNTSTSMDTFINARNSHNSQLSFANATVTNSSTFASSYLYSQNSQQLECRSDSTIYMLRKRGGTAMVCVDGVRYQNSFTKTDISPNSGQHQSLPLQYSSEPNHQKSRYNSNPHVNISF